MEKIIWSIVLSWVCLALATAGIGIRDAVSACDGKVYKKRDKIMLGIPRVSGYLSTRTSTKDGKISTMSEENLASREAVIVDTPDYDEKFFEGMGVYPEVETHPFVVVEPDGRRLCININDALSQGNIVSEYFKGKVESMVDLTPDFLFVYVLKLNNVTVDDDVIVRCMAHCDKSLIEKNQAGPLTMAGFKGEYAAKLEKALGDVDFSKVFCIESQSEMLQHDMDKQISPLKGSWCLQAKTDQPDALTKIGFCKWDDYVFRFVNISEFMNVSCEMARTKGFCDMRRVGKVPTYNKPLVAPYTYIRLLNKKVQLPEKKNKVYHSGDAKSMFLANLYGKMAIEVQIIKASVYHLPFLKMSDLELPYSYLGSIEVK